MDYREKIGLIKSRYLLGDISYEQTKSLVEDMLVEMNTKGAKIAKKFKKKYKKLTFGYVFR